MGHLSGVSTKFLICEPNQLGRQIQAVSLLSPPDPVSYRLHGRAQLDNCEEFIGGLFTASKRSPSLQIRAVSTFQSAGPFAVERIRSHPSAKFGKLLAK